VEGNRPTDPQIVERIREKTTALLESRRRFPESTYRLQFHAGFTFKAATDLVPYLHALGVTHCYASPYLKARPGSTHGYDIIDHASLNPEIGSDDDYNRMVEAFRQHGLGQILDIVPNHMGVATNDNSWWNDVLENGPASRYAGLFDIAWQSSPRPELQNKVLLPVLGEPYGEVLEAGQLALTFENGAFAIGYFDRRFPIDPRTYSAILGHRIEELQRTLGPEDTALLEYESISTASRNLPDRLDTDGTKILERSREKEIIKRRLAALTAESAPVRDFIAANVTLLNGTPGDAASFDPLDRILEQQAFRLSYWRVAPDEINYRRFFDINDLAALSMEREEVFVGAHVLVLKLAAEGKLDGLRIDHPDGLYDPAQYLRRLQEHFVLACARTVIEADPELASLERAPLEVALRENLSADASLDTPYYVVVEKILGAGEPLLESWATHGTTGYEFANAINGLFVDTANEHAFSTLYHDFIGDETRFSELVYRKKLLILQVSLAGELHMLTHQLDRLAQKSRLSRDFTFNTLRRALREVIACLPVYRSYIADDGIHPEDRRYIEMAVRRATVRNPLLSRRVFRFIRNMLLLEAPPGFNDADRAEQRRFAGKFQQVTAPVMAKGLEDTAFYVYNRLTSLNEVGGDPGRFGMNPDAVHAFLQDRQAKWPFALSPLSTHDTKRSEDVRARLNVLSEIPEEWAQRIHQWSRLNEAHRQQIDDVGAPDANEEYLLYQTLVGAWPLDVDAPVTEEFVRRIQAYMEKATREAKVHTSWINPNPEFDRAVADFVARLLDEAASAEFLFDLRAFLKRVIPAGLLNSLAQTLLKITSPGVPDTYQGMELWDFSLVDPDNRRPVDYARRRKLLEQLQQAIAGGQGDLKRIAADVMSKKEDGRIKMYVTLQALNVARTHPGLFTTGEYLPLRATGERASHLFAFARRKEQQWAVVVTPRLLAKAMPEGDLAAWGDTGVPLDAVSGPVVWRNVFTGAKLDASSTGQPFISATHLLRDFPVALLLSESQPSG
jgi:(1->4)-alpha-D-glucan 1-alpha-D-glucosylmutase